MNSVPAALLAKFVSARVRASFGALLTLGVTPLLADISSSRALKSPQPVMTSHLLLKLECYLFFVVESRTFVHLSLWLQNLDNASLLVNPGSVHRYQDRPCSRGFHLHTYIL